MLIPTAPPRVELVGRDGGEPEVVDLDRDSAQSILRQAAEAASAHGLGFGPRSLVLTPAPKFEELIRKSRIIAAGEKPGND